MSHSATQPHTLKPMTAYPADTLAGTVRVPGDKSISQRALLLGAMAIGVTRIDQILDSADIHSTANALRALGIRIEREPDGAWLVYGVGSGGLAEPDGVLDLGNSGTGARLLTGLLATHGFTSFLTGDASLVKRPMRRILEPLEKFGARFVAHSGERLPMAIMGATQPLPVSYSVPVPSAQVKSAILLAALNTPGLTQVSEAVPTRDHTERMLAYMGAAIESTEERGGGRTISLKGYADLTARPIVVPSDPSSAAFPIVAALVVPGAAVTALKVGMSAGRTGLFETLREMGAALEIDARADVGGEPVADISAASGPLRAVSVPAARAAAMIDEYPILAVAAACASGTTRFNGVAELRVKESDRLAATEAMLCAAGLTVRSGEDWMEIDGVGGRPKGSGAGSPIATHYDHRIAMSALILGLACETPIGIDDGAAIETSFPGFADLMRGLGARLESGT